MATLLPVNGVSPNIHESVWLAPNATVVGQVEIGSNSTVWFSAVVRGDVAPIQLGEKVNIQDGAVIHGTYQKSETRLENGVSVGHNAIVHGCELKDRVLVGMGSVIMDHCVIGPNSIIAAGAVLPQGTIVPPGTIYGGVPAKKIKTVDTHLQKGEIERIAENYLLYASWFKAK